MSYSNSKIVGRKRAVSLVEEISKMTTEEIIECWNKAVKETRGIRCNVLAEELLKDREQFFKQKDLEKNLTKL